MKLTIILATGLVIGVVCTPAAHAQAVAFAPVVGVAPSGAMLNVTPVVTHDRRYVRMGVNVGFFDLQGFQTVVVPGAVSGGGGAGGLPTNFAKSLGSPFNPNNPVPIPAALAAPFAARQR